MSHLTTLMSRFQYKNINFVDQLVYESCQFEKWQTLKDKYHLKMICILNRLN